MMNKNQFAKILVRGHYYSPVNVSHLQYVYVGHSRRNRRCINAVVPEVAYHSDHFDTDVGIGKKLHFKRSSAVHPAGRLKLHTPALP